MKDLAQAISALINATPRTPWVEEIEAVIRQHMPEAPGVSERRVLLSGQFSSGASAPPAGHLPHCPADFPYPPIVFGAERAASIRYRLWVNLCNAGAINDVRAEPITDESHFGEKNFIRWTVSGVDQHGKRHAPWIAVPRSLCELPDGKELARAVLDLLSHAQEPKA